MGKLLTLPSPTSVATFKALTEDAIRRGQLDDARLFDDQRHAAQVREWRLKAQRAERRRNEAWTEKQEARRTVELLVAVTDTPLEAG